MSSAQQKTAQILAQSNPKAATSLKQYQTSAQKFKTMPDVARWIHAKMISNPETVEGRTIKITNDLIDSFVQDPSKQILIPSLIGASFGLWANRVDRLKPWDYKNHIYPNGIKNSPLWAYDIVSKLYYRRDLWGNLHYGFVGRAVGFSKQTLRQGGGAAQLLSNLLTGRTGNILDGIDRLFSDFDAFASFDPPDDLSTVEVGIDLFDRYGVSLSQSQFIGLIRRQSNKLPTKK